MKKFGYIVNTLKQSKIKSSRPSFSAIPSFISNKQVHLQVWTTCKVENLQNFPHINTGKGYIQEGVSQQVFKARIRV